MFRYKHGDLITISVPFVYGLNASERGLRCDFCFRNSKTSPAIVLKPCSKRCKFSFYCNFECEQSAWKSFHKDECSKLSAFCQEYTPTDSQLFFARLLCKVSKNGGRRVSEEVCGVSRSFVDLKSHLEDIKADEERLKQFAVLERFIMIRFPELKYDITDLLTIFGKMVINMYAICDSERRPIGTGLYLGASIFDHCCDPNAVAIFNGTSIQVRAIKDFDCEGPREVFVDYIDPISQTSERQKHLMKEYYFMCRCNLCVNEDLDKMKTFVLKVGFETDVYLSNCLQLLNNSVKNKTEEKGTLFESCCELLEGLEKFVTEGHIYRIWLLRMAFDLAYDLQLWKDCLRFSLELRKFYNMYYCNRYYPAVGIQLLKVGKIQYLLGRYNEAETSLLEANELLTVCYQRNSELMQDLRFVLRSCRSELYTS